VEKRDKKLTVWLEVRIEKCSVFKFCEIIFYHGFESLF
jgi:hypothetical protein